MLISLQRNRKPSKYSFSKLGVVLKVEGRDSASELRVAIAVAHW